MVNVSVLVSRVRGVMTNPMQTLAEHLQPVPPWSVVTREHVLPLLVITGLLASLLVVAFSPVAQVPGAPGIDLAALALGFVLRIIVNFVLILVLTVIVGVFAVLFDGRPKFNGAFALVALAMTPVFLAEAIGYIPLIGMILMLASLVYAMVILYRGVPMALQVPENKRVLHFIMTLATMFVMFIVVSAALLPYLINPMTPVQGP